MAMLADTIELVIGVEVASQEWCKRLGAQALG